MHGCDVITWTKSELSNISYAFNFLCRIYRVKHDFLSSIYEYTGQSDILDEITNRRRRFVAQSLCNPNSLVQYFASVIAQ